MEGYIGEIRMFAGSFAPRGWMLCQGQQLSISTYQTSYVILGTTYGGDGINTFNLPNLGGRVPVGTGQRSGSTQYQLGQVTGTEQVTLTTATIPLHSHTATFTQSNAAATATGTLKAATGTNTLDPTNAYVGADGNDSFFNTPGSTLTQLAANAVTVNSVSGPTPTLAVGITGSSVPHDNMQPYLAVSYIICVEGIFPSRN